MPIYYKINGEDMPLNITEFSPEVNHLYGEATGRDEAGYNHLELIRANVRKWKITHEMLTRAEVDQIVGALNPLGFDFVGMHSSGYVSANCYGNITDMACTAFQDDSPTGSYWTLSLSIVEN